jgi:hypothetical protein
MIWEPLTIKCTILSCGWLASSFAHCACMRELTWEYQLKYMTSSLLGVACFLDQPLWLLQLSIPNVPRITTFMLAFQVPSLVNLPKAVSPYQREKWPLSKEPFLILTWNDIVWSIKVMDLIWWVTLNSSLSPFSFYLFKSFSFYQMISNYH